jgi:hypothetical protein
MCYTWDFRKRRLTVWLIISLSLFTCEVRNTCCQIVMTPYYKLFRPAFNANLRLRETANRGRDVFVHSWMRLYIRVGEIFSFFHESVWMSKRGRYFGSYVNVVGCQSGREIFVRWWIRLDIKMGEIFVSISQYIWTSKDIFILSLIWLDIKIVEKFLSFCE